MRAAWRSLRRAPGRSAASVLALALAVAAMGVFAVPTVATDSLRRVAAADRIAHVTLDTTPIPDPATLAAVPGIAAASTRTVVSLPGPDGGSVRIVGIDDPTAPVDRVHVDAGRLPRADDEVALGGRLAGGPGLDVGDVLTVGGHTLRIVGVADTTALAGEAVAYTSAATARALGGVAGPTQVVARVADPTAGALHRATGDLRRALAAQGVTVTALPVELVGGAHPIEDGTREISTMIGMLGIVAGVVALVLLASTTNAIVTERSRDAAIMRALGAPGREVRRELRRVALTIAAAGLVLGLPLGVLVSNAIARMVVERFAGITPGIGWSPVVVAASIAFALVGARVISGRAARRLTRQPLAEALRDREGAAFGRRLGDRLVSRLRVGSLTLRMAVRSIVRRRGRAAALVAQVACAVGAAACVASLVTSVGRFNEMELASWRWSTATTAAAPGLPFTAAAVGDLAAGTEAGITADARVGEWEFEVWGLDPATRVVDTAVSDGRWLDGTPGTLVLADHIADQLGIAVGDTVTLRLATGPARLRVVGLHPIRGVTAFVDRTDLADRLGVPGGANTIWAAERGGARAAAAAAAGVTTTTVRRSALYATDEADRNAITGVFVAIGIVVAGVATVGAVTTVGVSGYERRRELAVVRALGARRAGIRRVLLSEVGPLALVGWAVGLVAGSLAAQGIMAFFQVSSGVALGYTFAAAAIPVAAVAVAAFAVLVTAAGARGLDRRAPAAILPAAS